MKEWTVYIPICRLSFSIDMLLITYTIHHKLQIPEASERLPTDVFVFHQNLSLVSTKNIFIVL